MLSISQLTEKIDDIKDSDVMLIEDADDTKSITLDRLSEYLQKNSDKKIEDVKDTIISECKKEINDISTKYQNVAEAYYNLARNYQYLNSAFEAMKEKMLEIKQGTETMNITYDENTETLNIGK